MAYITGFSDNQLIGVDDLNAITKRLVTSGVGDVLTDTGSIEVTSLNGLTAAVLKDGVVPETNTSLKVSKSGNIITIQPGLAFFADGSFIEITSAHTLSSSLVSGYVYLLNDVALGERKPKVTASYPAGDFVMLAQIVSGSIVDKRKYAKGRVPAYSSYSGYPLLVSKEVQCTGADKWNRKGSFTVDLGESPLNGIAIKGANTGKPDCNSICFFDENKKVSVYRSVPNYNTSTVHKNYLLQYFSSAETYCYLTFSCTSSGVLTVNVFSSSGYNSASSTCTEYIEFLVF